MLQNKNKTENKNKFRVTMIWKSLRFFGLAIHFSVNITWQTSLWTALHNSSSEQYMMQQKALLFGDT